jgi:DNA transformation protein and related proteins
MAARSTYLEFITEQMAPLGRITSRPMFGGYCLYCDGIVFGLIASDTLYLKVDDVNRPEFEAVGAEAFRPFENQTQVMKYYTAPADLFESVDGLERWGRGAVEAGKRAQTKAPRRRKGRSVHPVR